MDQRLRCLRSLAGLNTVMKLLCAVAHLVSGGILTTWGGGVCWISILVLPLEAAELADVM